MLEPDSERTVFTNHSRGYVQVYDHILTAEEARKVERYMARRYLSRWGRARLALGHLCWRIREKLRLR